MTHDRAIQTIYVKQKISKEDAEAIFEERIAIKTFDAGISYEDAYRQAFRELTGQEYQGDVPENEGAVP